MFRVPFIVSNENLVTLFETKPRCTIEDMEFGVENRIVGGCSFPTAPQHSADPVFGERMTFPCPVLGDGSEESNRARGLGTILRGDAGDGIKSLRVGVIVEYKIKVFPGVLLPREYRTEFKLIRQKDGTPVLIETGPLRPIRPDLG